jgi:hypothetical protein
MDLTLGDGTVLNPSWTTNSCPSELKRVGGDTVEDEDSSVRPCTSRMRLRVRPQAHGRGRS